MESVVPYLPRTAEITHFWNVMISAQLPAMSIDISMRQEVSMTSTRFRMILMTLFWTLILMAGVSGICSAQSTLYFPQIADGIQGGDLSWATAIALTNTAAIGTATASGTITFTQDNGSPLHLLLVDEQERPLANGNSVSFQISGGQTRFFLTGRFTGAISELKTGYATVTSTQPLAGSAIFIQGLAAKQIGEASVF